MDAALFNEKFEVVVLGTGLIECILAGALARAGKKVLHLDRNDFYGGRTTSFTLEQILDWSEPSHSGVTMRMKTLDVGDTSKDSERSSVVDTLFKCVPENCSVIATPQRAQRPFGDTFDMIKVSSLKSELDSMVKSELYKKYVNESTSKGTHANTEEKEKICSTRDCEDLQTPSKNITQKSTSEKHITNESNSITDTTRDVNNDVDSSNENINSTKQLIDENVISNENDEIMSPKYQRLFTLQKLLEQNRNFSIDLSPRLLLARGTMCDVLARSGVGRYLEFQIIDESFVFLSTEQSGVEQSDVHGDIIKSAPTSVDTTSYKIKDIKQKIIHNKLVQVPCSKGDVFKSRWMGLKEKRILMKFLQFCVDLSTTGGLEEASNRNEKLLGAGRSLTRPQNKQTGAYKTWFIHKPQYNFNDLSIDSKKPTQNSESNSSSHLVTTETGMLRICQYLQSLGRFSRTAFLWTLYGAGEVPQAFSRLCAVYGGTYVLRERVQGIVLKTSTNNKSCCKGVVMSNGKFLPCKYVISSMVDTPQYGVTVSWMCRLIAVVDGPLLPDSGKSICVLPPTFCSSDRKGWGNSIKILQIDPSSLCTPKKSYLIYFSIAIDSDSIDETKEAENILHATLEGLLDRSPSNAKQIADSVAARNDSFIPDPGTKVQWYISFRERIVASKPRYDLPENLIFCGDVQNRCNENGQNETLNNRSNQIHTNGITPGFDVHFEDAVKNAETLFHQICPDIEFLPPPPKEVTAANQMEEDEWHDQTVSDVLNEMNENLDCENTEK